MRSYILTTNDRERLLKYLTDGAEDQQTRNLFTQIRRNTRTINDDTQIILLGIRKLIATNRWEQRLSSKDEIERALKRAKTSIKKIKGT